jgi:hypothetical protein
MQWLSIALAAGIAAWGTLLSGMYVLRALQWLPRYERWDRRAHGRCPECGYDLTGNASGVCPECGRAIDRRAIPPAAGVRLITESQPGGFWTAVVAVMVLAVVVTRAWR